ncbi:MAG TPA: TRAP transporter fused permease subunit, partial [Firmicutes bacterium]|nr:TRAP transporter fused permease subunit [Bacillota bacterium]
MPDNKTTIDLETGSLMLTHTGFLKKVVRFISVIIAIFHFYAAGFGAFSAMNQRSLHWLMLTCLAFLYYPATKKQKKISIFDYLFFGLALASGLYILLNWQTIIITRSGAASPTDIAFGIIAVIVVLEAARRTIGPVLPITALIFLAYTFIGPYLPMSVGHMGYSLSRLIAILYMSTEGIFGVAIGVSSSFIIMFVMFGGALKALGGGQFFIDLAYSVTGRLRGGPAKTAVISSALMGSVSGSPIANVVTTGSFTIPLMKHVGYKPHVAGAIESVASTGGQIMPPIMGAAAFIMAEFTLRPYFEIAWAALIPALLYYFAIYLVVDLESVKSGLKGLNKEDLPDLKETIIGGWFYAIPLGILIYLLMSGYSPTMSAFYTILLLYLVSCFKHKSLKKSFSLILDSFEEGVQNAIPVVAACAASGIVVGVISLTGLGLRIIGLVEVLSGGSMLIGLVFMMI